MNMNMNMNNLELVRRANYVIELGESGLDANDHGCLWFYGPLVGSVERYVWFHYPHRYCDKYRVAVELTAPHVFETNDFGTAMDMVCTILRRGMVTPDIYVLGDPEQGNTEELS